MRNEKNIEMHELIGLKCEVIKSTNPLQVGIKGEIVDETYHMLIIRTERGRKMVMKKGAKFNVNLNGKDFVVVGDRISYRPHERIKKLLRRRERW